ncbi:MAG TPA: superinfection immunity protein [Candidatus Angelobacter sp.]|jgi:hypothetical protein|nr:superinfection immunity protein [Candidatus Angelobacter sp.]
MAGGDLRTDAVALALAAFFAPTLVAAARHRGALGSTLAVNLLLGWTGVGWLLAWVLAFRDRRPLVSVGVVVAGHAAPISAGVLLAPDGRHWWNGAEWSDGWIEAPWGAMWSPAGTHWLAGGDRWVPAGGPLNAGCAVDASAATTDLPDEPEWWRRLQLGGGGHS